MHTPLLSHLKPVRLAHQGKGAVGQGRATVLETQHTAGVYNKAFAEQCPRNIYTYMLIGWQAAASEVQDIVCFVLCPNKLRRALLNCSCSSVASSVKTSVGHSP